MKAYKHIFKIGLFCLSMVWSLIGFSQSNVTSTLDITSSDLLATRPANSTGNFGAVRSGLESAGGDCFVMTATYSSGDIPPFPAGSDYPIYKTKFNSTLINEIGVTNIDGDMRWYIVRPTALSPIGKSVDLKYEIYDDLGVDGTFTFVISKYFTAIAVDDGSTDFKLAPVFFGMDSNVGTFSSHMGEFTGETNWGYLREVTVENETKIYRMSGDHKISSLIQALNHHNDAINNARVRHLFEQSMFDSSGNGVQSDLVDISTYSDESMEGDHALDFSGNNNYVDLDVTDQFIHDAFTQRTVAFWVKTSSVSGLQDLFDEGGRTRGMSIRINSGNVDMAVRSSASQSTIINSNGNILVANEWIHIAGVYDNGRLEMYVGGTSVALNSNVGFSSISTHSNGAGLGGTNDSNAFDNKSNNFNGLIDDFVLFDRALSQTEIQELIEESSHLGYHARLASEVKKEPEEPFKLALYPNPSNGTFQLDFGLEEDGSVRFKMLNLSGQTVLDQQLQFSKGNHQHLFENAGTLPKGLYVLEIVTNEFTESRRIIVE